MSVSRPTVSVVLLSYNRPHLLCQALASVQGQDWNLLEIIVVDNRSPRSEEVAQTVAEFPSVRLISNAVNLGYTGAMNLAIKTVRGQYVLLTEDDMVLAPSCVKELVCFRETHPEVALASGLIYKHATRTIHCAGGDLALGGIYSKKMLRQGETDNGLYSDPYPVTYITGAMVFAHSDLLRRLGGFRPDFFLYGEDDELCLRVFALGLPIMVVPRAVAEHFEHPKAPVSASVEFHKAKNFLALYLLHAPAYCLPEFVLRYGVIVSLRQFARKPRLTLLYLAGWFFTLIRSPWLLLQRWTGICSGARRLV
jgi:GT2 family glycosyltransferase